MSLGLHNGQLQRTMNDWPATSMVNDLFIISYTALLVGCGIAVGGKRRFGQIELRDAAFTLDTLTASQEYWPDGGILIRESSALNSRLLVSIAAMGFLWTQHRRDALRNTDSS